MNIKGKAAIITGSSSPEGIGGETAKLLAARGCNVVVNYAGNSAGAELVADECRAFGVKVIVVKGDVAQDADCVNMVEQALTAFGRLDILVNNAATTKPIKHKDMHLLDRAEFERVFAVNVIGNYQMCRAAEKPLKSNGDGAIVNISSVGAFRAGGSSMAYCASKAAVNNLTISMARIMAPEVRVNALCPGGLFGPWTNKILDEKAYQARVQAAKDEYPLGKGLWPKDVAEAALWLIEGASTMTGEAIRMDSGQHLGR
jgi:3-oxoacyl-[acyl-carrier protein] reductase